jgi:hypothetical protein
MAEKLLSKTGEIEWRGIRSTMTENEMPKVIQTSFPAFAGIELPVSHSPPDIRLL